MVAHLIMVPMGNQTYVGFEGCPSYGRVAQHGEPELEQGEEGQTSGRVKG